MSNINNLSSGLDNLGNTCFFNSTLQLLYQCTVLNKLILTNNFDGKLINIYLKFLKSYINSSKSFSPSEIVNYVSSNLGRLNYRQEDAEQYLNFIFDGLITEIREQIKKKSLENAIISNKSIRLCDLVTNLFTIKIRKTIICPDCEYKSISDDNVNILYLSVDEKNQNQELDQLISNYLFEILDENNKWKCERCNKNVKAIIQRKIIKLPKYIVIMIKRYTKNNVKINVPVDMYQQFEFENKQCHLRGIIYHSGSTGGGHYVYYGNKHNVLDNKWFHYSDSSVNNITEKEINDVRKYGYIYLYVNK